MLYNNRAFAHIKLGNWVSAIEDCDKAMYIREAFEEKQNDDTTGAKSYLRRAMCHSGRGDFEAAVADFETSLAVMPDDKNIKKQLKRARVDLAEQQKENEVEKSLADSPIKDVLEALKDCAADEQSTLLQKLLDMLEADEQLVRRTRPGIPHESRDLVRLARESADSWGIAGCL